MNAKLFDKRLLLVSGKGGVGKSTVCAAFALTAARLGKKTLIVEMDEKERIAHLFGHSNAGYEGATVHRNVVVRNLLPNLVMDEFIEVQVRPRAMAKQILGSQIYKYFAAAAPGLKEFVTLGKVMLLEEETDRRGRPVHDLIIVDAPASGHGVQFLRVPFAAAETVKVGWVRKQAERIIDLITDPERTLLNIVTLPEEMPVNETVEMCDKVDRLLGIPIGYIIINSVFPQVLKKKNLKTFDDMKRRAANNGLKKLSRQERELVNMMFTCYDSANRRRQLNEFYITKLQRALKYDLIQVPFVFAKNFDFALIEQVSDHLLRAIEKSGGE
jgi:anion-transporting  ArsA/GET3 family ATPase